MTFHRHMDDPELIADEVKPYLKHWGINPVAMSLASHSENIVYKVMDQTGAHYAFRVHRPGYHTPASLASEQVWTDALLHYGLKVPKAYPTDSGEFYISAQCGGTTRQLGLIAWLEGRPLDQLITPYGDGPFPMDMMREAGRVCAQFHNQATQWQPPTGFTRPHLDVDGLLGEKPFWGRFWEAAGMTSTQRRTIKHQRDTLRERLLAYGRPENIYSMIHADMHEENLMVSPDGLMVIDFDDAGFGWHQYDLAVILISHVERPDFNGIKQTLIEGYLSERAMSDADLAMIDLFILVRTLALIGWVTDRPELGRDDYAPALIDRACSLGLEIL